MIDRTRRPPIHNFEDVHLDFPKSDILSCGTPLWVINGGTEEVNRISVYVNGGTINESRPLQSLFTAMMAFEGSQLFTSSQIAEKLDYCGAWKTTQNYDDICEMSVSSVNEYFSEVLPILADALANPTFPAEEFELCKARYASAYATMRERVKYLAAIELRKLYYGKNHPLVANITPEQIMQLTTDDLKSFYNEHYSPGNCRIIISGKIEDCMANQVRDMMTSWQTQEPIQDDTSALDYNPSDPTMSVIDKPGAVQSAIAIAIRSVGRKHPDYLSLRVLCMVLGGYFGSRLMSNIREDKGYTYGINAFLAGRLEDGYIGISTECDIKYTWAVIEEIKREIKHLCEECMSENELNNVRQYMLSEQVKTLDTPFNVASYVASTFLYGVYPEYFNKQIETIINITPERLNEVAQKYLNVNQMLIAIASDASKLPSQHHFKVGYIN